MRVWTVQRGAAGYSVGVEEVPAYVRAAGFLGETLTSATFHFFCCHIPRWAWRIPLGWGRSDDEPRIWERSLGSVMWRFGNFLSMPFWRKRRTVVSIPIDGVIAQMLEPEFYDLCEADDVAI